MPPSIAVLVTGGAGYIGSHAVQSLLAAGHRPVILDDLSTGSVQAIPAGVLLIRGRVHDSALVASVVREHRIEAALHFAGSILVSESVDNPLKYYDNNVAGTIGLVTGCVEAGVRAILFSSTAAVYGDPERLPVREDDPVRPGSPYGWSKLMAERILADAAGRHGFAHCALRYFNVAGADPQGRTGHFGPVTTHLIRTACRVALGYEKVFQVFGDDYDTEDGSCVRDFIDVRDLADAHVAVLQVLLAGCSLPVLNCGYGHGYSVRQVVAAVQRVAGGPFPVTMAPRRAGDIKAMIADVGLIRRAVGWVPAHDDLDAMIAATLASERRRAQLLGEVPSCAASRG